jgi:hypothetical protein
MGLNCARCQELALRLEEAKRYIAKLEAVEIAARAVMAHLSKYGSSIVPHLIDTDDNDGEYLRRALRALES